MKNVLHGGVRARGIITAEIFRNGQLIDVCKTQNLIVDVGLQYALDAAFVGGAQTNWYVGLLGNATPAAGWTLTNAAASEITAYNEATRPAWTKTRTGETITNSASKALFTINVTTTDVYGAFLSTSSTKAGTTGTLFGAGLFASARTGLVSGDEVYITYQIDAASA